MLIIQGDVKVNGKIIIKPSFDVTDTDTLIVNDSIGYVGRGGLKLQYALEQFCVNVNGLDALDIGASTGGFTQCLLEHGAKSVVAEDVGHGQMAQEIADDERVVLLENTNARFLTEQMINGKKDICVMDVSFISQTVIFESMFSVLKDNGIAITLVKPQFEAGSKFLNKKGVIKDKRVYRRILENIDLEARKHGFGVENACVSPIKGGDGNTEFLILLVRNSKGFDFTTVTERI